MDNEFDKFLKQGNLIRLTSSNPVFKGNLGYVGAVFEYAFDFDEVTNAYEHVSNTSDPAILKTHRVNLSDVKDITK